MLCFHCQQPAAFEYRWPWNPAALGVCAAHVETLRQKASLAGQRMPNLEALTAPSSPKPELELDEPGAADTKPGLKRQPRELAAAPDGVVAAISITREAGVLSFVLRRPQQHDFGGPIAELGPTLVGLKLLAPPVEVPVNAPPALPRGAVPQLAHSNPQQVTPPGAAAALAGAGGGPPRERSPVNPPMPHLGAVHRTLGNHPAPPLGASVGAFAPPGGAAPTPPAVRPPGAAPVSPELAAGGPTDGSTPETSETVVEGGPGSPPVPP